MNIAKAYVGHKVERFLLTIFSKDFSVHPNLPTVNLAKFCQAEIINLFQLLLVEYFKMYDFH